MEKITIEQLLDQYKSTREIANILGVSQTSICYWMKKYSLKSKYLGRVKGDTKECSICRIRKHKNEFYMRSNKQIQSRCKKCHLKESRLRLVKRQRLFKEKCVEYKGGKCEICGYSKYLGALDFHHKNSIEKDFGIGQYRKYNFSDIVKKELDKCSLLCANCHREEHYRLFLEKEENL